MIKDVKAWNKEVIDN